MQFFVSALHCKTYWQNRLQVSVTRFFPLFGLNGVDFINLPRYQRNYSPYRTVKLFLKFFKLMAGAV